MMPIATRLTLVRILEAATPDGLPEVVFVTAAGASSFSVEPEGLHALSDTFAAAAAALGAPRQATPSPQGGLQSQGELPPPTVPGLRSHRDEINSPPFGFDC
jgi:hypothetical protein